MFDKSTPPPPYMKMEIVHEDRHSYIEPCVVGICELQNGNFIYRQFQSFPIW